MHVCSEGYSTWVCVSVYLSVSVKSHLTHGASVCPENAVTYSVGNKGQKICGDLPEMTAFKRLRNMSKKANMLIIPTYPRSAFST